MAVFFPFMGKVGHHVDGKFPVDRFLQTKVSFIFNKGSNNKNLPKLMLPRLVATIFYSLSHFPGIFSMAVEDLHTRFQGNTTVHNIMLQP